MWPRLAEIAMGAWLLASAWVFGHPVDSPVGLSGLASGAAIVLLALLSFWRPLRWAHLGQMLVALWLAGFGFLGDPDPLPALQSHILAAMVLVMFAIVPTAATRPPQSWRQPAVRA